MNQHRSFLLIVLLLTSILLVSCSHTLSEQTMTSDFVSGDGASDQADGSPGIKSASDTDSVVPAIKPSSTLTITTIPSSPTAAFTPIPVEKILEDYPIYIGSVWTYQVTVEYQDFNEESGPFINTWKGLVKETILSSEQIDSNSISYESIMTNYPHGWTYKIEPGELEEEYIVTEGGIDNPYSRIIEWPLEIGKWWYFSEDLGYVWEIIDKEELLTPAGYFEECYVIGLWTGPDTTLRWFCPGIGFARLEYVHRGTVHNEIWELVGYSFPDQ